MVGTAWIGVGVGVGAIVVLVLIYAILAHRSNQKAGVKGLVRTVRLTCPKCGRTFDFRLIPGVSFTSLRLGRRRYMSCPLCQRWSTFDVSGTIVAPPSSPPHSD
jgi:hypothetical protein